MNKKAQLHIKVDLHLLVDAPGMTMEQALEYGKKLKTSELIKTKPGVGINWDEIEIEGVFKG